jgi:hypothetical protein
MKKIIILATILLIAGTVSAQTYFNGERADYDNYYQPKFGFMVAGNISKASPGANFSTGSVTGITAGVNLDLPDYLPAIIRTRINVYSKRIYC